MTPTTPPDPFGLSIWGTTRYLVSYQCELRDIILSLKGALGEAERRLIIHTSNPTAFGIASHTVNELSCVFHIDREEETPTVSGVCQARDSNAFGLAKQFNAWFDPVYKWVPEWEFAEFFAASVMGRTNASVFCPGRGKVEAQLAHLLFRNIRRRTDPAANHRIALVGWDEQKVKALLTLFPETMGADWLKVVAPDKPAASVADFLLNTTPVGV